jgi:predicted Zn-dependent protease
MSRLDALRKFIEQTPNDPFPRYGLAMELKNLGQLAEAASAFAELEARFPDYVPQYLMHGNLLCELKRRDEARAVLVRGATAAEKARNSHALGEIRGALEALED